MTQIDIFLPYIIFSLLVISAIIGIRELAKESSNALKKKSHA